MAACARGYVRSSSSRKLLTTYRRYCIRRLTYSITGVTHDTFRNVISKTFLNPALTIPLILAARYSQKGAQLSAQHATAFKHLKTLLALGLLRTASNWLDDAVINNWNNDVYDWKKEVVVVTGGSDGIGKIVVQLLAEKGIKVAVMDVQELTYEGE